VDRDRNKLFWSNIPVNGAAYTQDIPFNLAAKWRTDCYNSAGCANHSHQWLGQIFLNGGAESIDAGYANVVNSEFARMKTIYEAGLSNPQETGLANVLSGNGVHSIHLEGSGTGSWSAVIEILTRANPNSPPVVIQKTILDQGHTLPPPIIIKVGT
jgi:hypothetical protein